MFDTILVCLDGSALAEQIIPMVKDEAEQHGNKVVLLHALNHITDLPQADPPPSPQRMTTLREKAIKYLEEIADSFRDHGINTECRVVEGKAADTIVKFAEENHVGLVALTTHGEGGLGRLVFGTTAVYVLRESTRPVLIVKPQRIAQSQPVGAGAL